MQRRRLLFPSTNFRNHKATFHSTDRTAGITLIELMVVISMFMGIAMVMVNLVQHSSAMVAKGTKSIELNQKARVAVDKLAPYLITACDEGGRLALKDAEEKFDAPTAEQLRSYKQIRFVTTENFLDPDWIRVGGVRARWGPTNDRYYYELYFDDQTSPKNFVTEKGETIKLGQIRLRRYLDREFTQVDTSVSSVPLAHNIQLFRCHKLDESKNLEVIVHTVGKRKGVNGEQVDAFEEARGIVNTPAPFYR